MERVLGQARAVEVLSAALRSGRMHHAYIFQGPAGVGKFTTAMAMAKVLLCPNAGPDLTGEIRACGACRACSLCDTEGHPDLHVIRKELARTSSVATVRDRKQTNIPIDLLREFVVGGTTNDRKFHDAAVYKSPLAGKHKVFVIDEAELLDREGQNALLKTLEEPPSGTFLFLITSREERLLPTVRSRCQRVAFVPLSDDIVGDWLAKQETDLDESGKRWLIGYSEGSLGRAHLALRCNLYEWARVVLPAIDDMTRGRCDGSLGGQIHAMIETFAKARVAEQRNASKEAANKLAVSLMWSLIGHEARLRLAAASASHPDDPDATEAAVSHWLAVIDALGEAQQHINSNVNMNIVCDHLVSRIDRALVPTSTAATR